jgi:hypothetical protein
MEEGASARQMAFLWVTAVLHDFFRETMRLLMLVKLALIRKKTKNSRLFAKKNLRFIIVFLAERLGMQLHFIIVVGHTITCADMHDLRVSDEDDYSRTEWVLAYVLVL